MNYMLDNIVHLCQFLDYGDDTVITQDNNIFFISNLYNVLG